tara:strand:+ start:1488 stop:1667 length:180 start_codon:yes stop_codon:yes gene_type:complete
MNRLSVVDSGRPAQQSLSDFTQRSQLGNNRFYSTLKVNNPSVKGEVVVAKNYPYKQRYG